MRENCIFCQGCCVGQGTISNLSKSGLDVQSLVSIPEADSDIAIETDNVQVVQKNQDTYSTQTATVKPGVCNFLLNS